MKLKSLVLDYFMPPEAVVLLESRARWNDEEDDFTLDRLELAGNTLRPRQRPPSASSVRRPETSSSDKSRAKKYVMAPQNDDEDDEIARAEELELARNPFFMYVSDNEGDGYAPAASRKKQSTSSSSSRPKTAKKSSSKSSSKRPETASSKRRSEKSHA